MPLDHIRLLVVNFAECFRFYRDILQLQPSWGDEADRYASFTHPQNSKIVLALFRRQAMSEVIGTSDLPLDQPAQDRTMLIFPVQDVDATVATMKQQGLAFVKEPMDFPDWGIRCAYLRDPDGNLIELNSALAEDKWSDALREAAERWKS